ncbi:PfkB family carbohydrate kinase [Wukongibacter baidiensis]|uniref:carbohydrate kinase family protein n=1 Tax=Wukongibacter baidiensis TaxID=1723361 RepID=UPI003D7FD648
MEFISVFGQMNLDIIFDDFGKLPDLGEEVFAKNFDMQLGGGPMVYPIVLSRFGIDARLGTFFSDDIQSKIAKKLLEEMDFTNYKNFYEDKDGHPVVVTSVLSFEKDRSFICFNEQVRETSLNEEKVYDFLKGSKVVFAPHRFNRVMERLKKEGSIMVFDTGWQEDLDINMYKDTLKMVDVFTPNDKEAMKMTGTGSPEDAVKELARYVKHPIVSIGEKGCITFLDNQVVHVPMPTKFKVIDTTGAGDNFLAGIIYGLFNDWDIVESMKMGNVLGGYSTTALGCYRANITLEKAMEYMKLYK